MERQPEEINFDDYLSSELQQSLLEGFKIMSDEEILDMANSYNYNPIGSTKHAAAIILFCHKEVGFRRQTNQSIDAEQVFQARSDRVADFHDQLDF